MLTDSVCENTGVCPTAFRLQVSTARERDGAADAEDVCERNLENPGEIRSNFFETRKKQNKKEMNPYCNRYCGY